MPMATKLDRMVTYLEGLLSIKSHDHFNYAVLQGHLAKENHITSTTTVPMITKRSNVVTSLEGLLPIK